MTPAQPYNDTDDQNYQRDDDGKGSTDRQNLEVGHSQCGGVKRLGCNRKIGFTAKQAVEQCNVILAIDKGASVQQAGFRMF